MGVALLTNSQGTGVFCEVKRVTVGMPVCSLL